MKFIIESILENTRHNQPCKQAYPVFITGTNKDGNKSYCGTWEIEIDSLDELIQLQKDLKCEISLIQHDIAKRPCIIVHKKY